MPPRLSRKTPGWTGLALLLLALSAPARAERPVMLHSFTGAPSEDARYFVDYVARGLGKDAPLHGEALRRRIEASLSRTAGSTEPPPRIKHLVEEGRRQFIEGEFDKAIEELERARGLLMSKVAVVASDQTLRDALHKTLLVLAHALLRTKQGERATELVGQAIRSFPDRDLSMIRYGPDLVAFYKKVRREMDRQPRGTLTISTRPEKCLVFLNERFVGLSPARVVDLYPGRYRVYVQRPREPGRIHLATVDGGDHQLTVDFDLDRVLTTEPLVGLRFPSQASLEQNEVRQAASVARALDAPMAILMGLRQHNGRRVLQGTAVALEPATPSPDTLKALGLFLVAGKPGDGIIVAGGAVASAGPVPAPPAEADTGPGFFSARVFKWVTLGVAVAGLAAGITLIVLDGRGTCDAPEGALCRDTYETMTPGIVLTAAGGAAAVGSGVLFWLDARSTSRAALVPQLGPRQAGLAAVWVF
jgi:hypothetical protein